MKGQSKSRIKSDLEKKTEELRNQLTRALADYDNLRKRTESEKEEFEKFANLRLIFRMLSVLDMLENAQGHLQDTGLAITINEFNNIFKEEGIEKIKADKGDRFDENLHEAVEVVAGGKKGEIAEVVLTGWKYTDGPVIRVAKVKVFGEKSQKEEELEKEMGRGEYV